MGLTMRSFYVNGQFVAEAEAVISVMDRGFLMADGIYEVIAVLDAKLVDFEGHWLRLARSLGEIGIQNPFTREEFLSLCREIASLNALDEGGIYIQITRGVAERDFLMPEGLAPSVVMFTQARALIENKTAQTGLKVALRPDLRWQRGDIKTTQLLFASWMKTEAVKAGKDDCWLERDGMITEGTSNNAYIVKGGKIITRPLSRDILAGITRQSVLKLCENEGLELEERLFSAEEAKNADEAFVTSATAMVMGVTELDNAQIGGGQVGPLTRKLRELYIEMARETGV